MSKKTGAATSGTAPPMTVAERVKRYRAKKKAKAQPAALPVLSALTAKQERFAQEYAVDFNGTRAALRAGYSPASARSASVSNMQNPTVRAAVDAVRAAMRAHFSIDATDVLAEIHALATSNMADYHRLTKDGEPLIDLTALTRRQTAAIAELQVEDFMDGRGKDQRQVRRVRIKLADKLPALIALARMCGVGVPDPEGKGGPGPTPDAMREKAAARARRMPDEALTAIADLIRQQRAIEAAALNPEGETA